MHLVGDIGGTKTHLAIVDADQMVRDQKFASGDYQDLITIAREFLGDGQEKIDKVCFGVAGPVRDGRCQATNLPWVIDSKELASDLGASAVYLLNDLEANAWGINVLKEDQLFVLNQGVQAAGNAGLISAGTGLGEAGMYYDGQSHRPFATEGGHTEFGPRTDLEIELLIHLRKKFGHVSYERVLSGPGLADIYRFLVDVKGEEDVVDSDVEEAQLPRQVSDKGLEENGSTCRHALELFVDLYGAEAGNLALKLLALGGIFVGGGIAPKILPLMKTGRFMQSFCEKGRFESLMKDVPVKVILEENTAMFGTAHFLSSL